MRLLQVQFDGHEIDLHPMLTVIGGLDDSARARLIAAVRALPGGRDPGLGGLVESHGVLFDLNVETLQLLGLESDLDPLVRRGDLPGAVPDVAQVARLSTEQFLTDAPEGAYPELDEARRRQRQARETLALLREATERTRRDHTEAASRARQAAAALAAARAHEASGGLEPVEVLTPADRPELEGRRADLAAALGRVEKGLTELSSLDTKPIEVLLEAIRNPSAVEYVPSERAGELADEFVALRSRVDELEQQLEQQGRGTASALARLETARVEVAAAEKAMQKPELSSEDVAELEAAHEAVLEAEASSTGRLRRGNQRRFEEAQAAEQAVLDRVGFPTWSAYVMGAGLLAIDPIAEQRLERARFDLEAAESHWAQVAERIEADPEHRQLLDQLEAVYLEAFDLLGGDDEQGDLELALRSLQVPKREISTEDLTDALAYQLELVGLDLGEAPGIDRTLLAADAFLTEVRGISDRVAELEQERSRIGDELADVDHALERIARMESPAIDLTDGETPPQDLESLAIEAARAEQDEADHADALEARSALVDAATQIEAVASSQLMRVASQLAEEHAASEPVSAGEPRPASDPAFDLGPDEVDSGPEAIEFYLLARMAAQRSVSFAGSVPLVVDDALAGLPDDQVASLLTKLQQVSESVQILYLSDDPTVRHWALGAGLNQAAVVEMPPQYA